MIVFLFFVLLFVLLAAACIAGWGVDSRDSRFSLFPLPRVGERGSGPTGTPTDARPVASRHLRGRTARRGLAGGCVSRRAGTGDRRAAQHRVHRRAATATHASQSREGAAEHDRDIG